MHLRAQISKWELRWVSLLTFTGRITERGISLCHTTCAQALFTSQLLAQPPFMPWTDSS
uniref:Uncharacterized protein n=1 Tax=Anguilla anguilla TaxID=7936 RepID=A0A0E9TWR5_ANGAN